MLRVKFSEIPNDIKEVAVDAIDEIESKTNVRFYNSIKDLEYYEPGHIRLPNIAVRMDGTAVEGSGSYGLVGGEQFINVPTALKQANYDEIKRFLCMPFAMRQVCLMSNREKTEMTMLSLILIMSKITVSPHLQRSHKTIRCKVRLI